MSEVALDHLKMSSPGMQDITGKLTAAFGTYDLDHASLVIELTHEYSYWEHVPFEGDYFRPEKLTYKAGIGLTGSKNGSVTFEGNYALDRDTYPQQVILLDVFNPIITKQDNMPATGRLRTIISEPATDRVSVFVNYASRPELAFYSLYYSADDTVASGITTQGRSPIGINEPYMTTITTDSNRYDKTLGTLGSLGIVVNPAGSCVGPFQPGKTPKYCETAPVPAPSAPVSSGTGCVPIPDNIRNEAGFAVGGFAVANAVTAKATMESYKAGVALAAAIRTKSPSQVWNAGKGAVGAATGQYFAHTGYVAATDQLEGARKHIGDWARTTPNHCTYTPF